jgi:hypothetical protein
MTATRAAIRLSRCPATPLTVHFFPCFYPRWCYNVFPDLVQQRRGKGPRADLANQGPFSPPPGQLVTNPLHWQNQNRHPMWNSARDLGFPTALRAEAGKVAPDQVPIDCDPNLPCDSSSAAGEGASRALGPRRWCTPPPNISPSLPSAGPDSRDSLPALTPQPGPGPHTPSWY